MVGETKRTIIFQSTDVTTNYEYEDSEKKLYRENGESLEILKIS